MAKFVETPKFMAAEAGDGYWSIASALGYPPGPARDAAAQQIQAANSNQQLWPGTLVMIPADLAPPVVVPPVSVGNYADWWWLRNGGDPRFAKLVECNVTSPADSGPGSLRDALSQSGRRVRFPTPLTITLLSPIVTKANNIHLVGSGSTIKHSAVKFEGTNIVVSDVRFADAFASAAEDNLTFRNATQTQVFAVQDCVFDRANDGGLDIIWNRGHDVFGVVERCAFYRIDKACLIDSGDDANEGGRYHVTFVDTVWEDCIQRMPMARHADIHHVRPRILRYGDHVGAGGGAKAAEGCLMLVEEAVIKPRLMGETMFNGAKVTKPRLEAVGPQLSTNPGAVRAVNCPPAPQVIEREPASVLAPPYA